MAIPTKEAPLFFTKKYYDCLGTFRYDSRHFFVRLTGLAQLFTEKLKNKTKTQNEFKLKKEFLKNSFLIEKFVKI